MPPCYLGIEALPPIFKENMGISFPSFPRFHCFVQFINKYKVDYFNAVQTGVLIIGLIKMTILG